VLDPDRDKRQKPRTRRGLRELGHEPWNQSIPLVFGDDCGRLSYFIGVISLIRAQKAPQRVTFARGATVVHATEYLRGINDAASFVLRARAGQHMRVEINGRGATRGGSDLSFGEAGRSTWRSNLRRQHRRIRRLSHSGY